eukprot:6378805-Pyramimonas_sp.AAC.1
MCLHATAWGWRVFVTGQWDGSLCHGCAMGALANQSPMSIPRDPASRVGQLFSLKVMGGYIRVYADH